MPRYIDADGLMQCTAVEYDKYNPDTLSGSNVRSGISLVAYLIKKHPAADVQPVKHGRWIDTEPEYNYERHCYAHYQCSECGRRTGIRQTRTYKYCPNCGAKMEGCDK